MVKKMGFMVFLCTLLLSELGTNALPYDYTVSIECLENPWKPQYNGGIIINPELNIGIEGWNIHGDAKIELRESTGGNRFIAAHSRNQPSHSASQKINLERNMLYTFSAWLQVSEGKAAVTAIFKTTTGLQHVGAVVAQSKCWSMLKGGFTVDESGAAELYFESNNTAVEVWVDNVSLQPFTQEEWSSHQQQSIQKNRNTNTRIRAVDEKNNPLPNATITISQKSLRFPFGCAITKNILTNTAYQNWFTSRFTVTAFENEMKWYSTEPSQGREDYSTSDAMINFAQQHSIAVRGHAIFWNDAKFEPDWVIKLSSPDLYGAAKRRLSSIISRYRGKVNGWDVVNENLHRFFLESKLGGNASAIMYGLANEADPNAILFLNDYNTIEDHRDVASIPINYLQKLTEIKNYPGNADLRMGIGLEGHFALPNPNLAYARSSLDTLAAAGVPVWITELDVSSSPNQAQLLEDILRELYSHPAVNGIVIWAPWSPWGCYRMCLIDNNFNNLPTGDVVDKLLHEWGFSRVFEVLADSDGFFEVSLSHGDYEAKITHHTLLNSSSTTQTFTVTPTSSLEQVVLLQVSA